MTGPFQWRRLHIRVTVGGLRKQRKRQLQNLGEGWTSCVYLLNHVQLFAPIWTVARQAPLSMGFSRHEYWSGWNLKRSSTLLDSKQGCVWKPQHQIQTVSGSCFLETPKLLYMLTVTLRSPLNEGIAARLETEAASLDQSDLNPSSKNRVFHCYWYNFHSRAPSSVWFQRTKLLSELESRHSKKGVLWHFTTAAYPWERCYFLFTLKLGFLCFSSQPSEWPSRHSHS